MDSLIVLIIIGAFVGSIFGEKKGAKQKRKNQSVPNQRRQLDRMKQGFGTRNVREQYNPNYYYQQQKYTKERLQQKYGLQKKVTPKTDILSRAKENVQENESDAIQQQMHMEACRAYRDTAYQTPNVAIHKMQSANCDAVEESDVMKKVNDLIVTGYSGDMHFERDFIAEGIDMLNRFSL